MSKKALKVFESKVEKYLVIHENMGGHFPCEDVVRYLPGLLLLWKAVETEYVALISPKITYALKALDNS